MCQRHYWQTFMGDGPRANERRRNSKGTIEDRFWDRVDRRGPDECWPWIGSVGRKGYGKLFVQRKHYSPHRFSYELHLGPIPEGFEVDHLCRNTGCVNPAHLEAVTPAENMRRRFALQTHCKRGHEFTPENTKRHSVTGYRVCAQCVRDSNRETMRARREKTRKRRPHLTADTVRAIRRRAAEGLTTSAVAREFGISVTSASLIIRRKQWVNID